MPKDPETYLDATSFSLLERAKQADPLAWDQIVDCYGSMVFHWCRTAGLSPEAARDVGQEVFLAAYRNLDRFTPRHHVGSFRSWLRSITRSKFADHVKQHPAGLTPAGGSEALRRVQQLEFPPDDESAVHSDTRLVYLKIEEFIHNEFSDTHCRAFYMVSSEQLSAKEAAQQLDMTRNAVYLACSKIRRRVKEEFGDLMDGFEQTPNAARIEGSAERLNSRKG